MGEKSATHCFEENEKREGEEEKEEGVFEGVLVQARQDDGSEEDASAWTLGKTQTQSGSFSISGRLLLIQHQSCLA